MQVKCEVFSRFGNSVDFSSGEPLGGVGASTVGADLCVRLSSPERSLFCGGVSIVHLSFERGRRLGILLSSDAKDVFRQVRFEVCKSDYLEAFSTLFASRSGVLRG